MNEDEKKTEILEYPTEAQSLKLGPRMLKAVHNKLEATFANFRYHSQHLAEVEESIWKAAEDGELSSLTLDEIVGLVKARIEDCHLVSKLHENLLRDIYLRSKHYRTWFTDPLYLTEHYARSSSCDVKKTKRIREEEE